MYTKILIKHSKQILTFSLMLLIVAIWVASGTTMATNMSDMLPSDHEFIRANQEFEGAFGSGEKVYIALSGPEEGRHQGVKQLFEHLTALKSPVIESLYGGNFKTETYLDAKKDNLSVLIVTPKLDGGDFVNQRNQFFSVLEGAIAEVAANATEATNAAAVSKAHEPIEIAYTGGAFVLDYQADQVMESGIFSSIGIVLAMILVLLIFSFKRFSLPLLLAYPLLLGVILSFAIGNVIFGTLNLFTVFFAAVLFGLGIDFGIHLLTRYEALRYQGLSLENAIGEALKSTGTGIIIGALTTVVAFLSFAFATFKGFEQMGIFAALGISLLALAMLSLVPVLIVTFDGKKIYQAKLATMQFKSPLKASLWAKKQLLVASRFGVFILVTTGIIFFTQGHFDYNIASIYPDGMTSTLWQHRLEKAFETKIETLSVKMPSFEALKNSESQFEKEKKLEKGERNQLKTTSILTEIPLPIMPETQEALTKLLPKLPEFLVQNYIGKEGVYRLDIIPENSVTDLEDYQALESHVLAVTGQQPVGFLALMMTLSDLVMKDISKLSLLCLAFTGVVLLITFRRLSVALLLSAGLGLTLVATWGFTALMGISVNIISVVAFPILIGIGIDGFVHMAHRLLALEAGDQYTDAVKALTLTTLTTIMGFGSLAFVNHGGLSNLGKIVMIGMVLGYLVQVLLLPLVLLRNIPLISPHRQ